MASTDRLPNRKKTVKSSRGVESFDALDVVGNNPLNSREYWGEYVKNNDIQVSLPNPTGHAMDSVCSGKMYPANYNTVNQHVLAYFVASGSFIGYHAMALIAQNWLVMKGCSSAAKDAMKKGYELTKNDGSDLDGAKLRKIHKLDKKYKTKQNAIEGETFNNVFGIRHILFKHKDKDFDYEQPLNLNDFKNGKYEGISQIDPYWITPELSNTDITDPTSIDYYEPTFWLVNSKRYHKSHFVILQGEEVADYLKPTYRYGGIGMAQKVYERVYAGERTANEIPQLALTKRLGVRKTDLAKAQANKAAFISNLNVMNEFRDNYGVQVVGLEEDVSQLETSLADLDSSMWANYHLVAAVFGRPVSKLFGTGHNGFSTGDTDDDYDISMLESLQSGNLEDILYAHYERLMMSEFGEEMDMDIVWKPLKVMSEKELADVNYQNAQTDTLLNNIGAIDAVDSRDRIIADKNSGYSGIERLEVIEGNPDSPDGEVEQLGSDNNAQDGFAEDFVREKDGEWFVFSESGKRLSKGYSSKEEANKRLGEIEYFKHAKDQECRDSFDQKCADEMCEDSYDAEYQGKQVTLNKPFVNSEGKSKYSVYVKNDKGNVVRVNFGDKDMEIRRDNTEARANFRSRHDCENKTDKTTPGYWSCKFWSTKSVSELLNG